MLKVDEMNRAVTRASGQASMAVISGGHPPIDSPVKRWRLVTIAPENRRENAIDRLCAALDRAGLSTHASTVLEAIASALAEPNEAVSHDPDEELSMQEAAVLEQGASGLVRDPDVVARVRGRTAARYARLCAKSYDVEGAATLLKVTPARIRQLLLAHALYGFKVNNAWRLPLFQFEGSRPLPHLDAVTRKLSPTLHPLAVTNWFTTPNHDLWADDAHRVSPREWLLEGRIPEPLAHLAAHL